MNPIEDDEEDRKKDMISFRMYQIDKQRERIDYALRELDKDLNSVFHRAKEEYRTRLTEWGSLVAFYIARRIVISLIAKKNAFPMAVGVLAVILLAANFVYLCYCLKKTMNYMVWRVKRQSSYIEVNRLYTFAKEEQYYLECIARVRERKKQLEEIERSLKKNGDLNEEQLQFVNLLNIAHGPKFIYDDKTVSVKDWAKVILFRG